MPTIYVVAPSNEIAFGFVNADYSFRAGPEEIIAALEFLRATTTRS